MPPILWNIEHDAILLIALEVLILQTKRKNLIDVDYETVIRRCNFPPNTVVDFLKSRRRYAVLGSVDPCTRVKSDTGLKIIKKAYELCLTPFRIFKDATRDEIERMKYLREIDFFHECLYEGENSFPVTDHRSAAVSEKRTDINSLIVAATEIEKHVLGVKRTSPQKPSVMNPVVAPVGGKTHVDTPPPIVVALKHVSEVKFDSSGRLFVKDSSAMNHAVEWNIRHDMILIIGVEMQSRLNKTSSSAINHDSLLTLYNFPEGTSAEFLSQNYKRITSEDMNDDFKILTKKGENIIRGAYEMCLDPKTVKKTLTLIEFKAIICLRKEPFFVNRSVAYRHRNVQDPVGLKIDYDNPDQYRNKHGRVAGDDTLIKAIYSMKTPLNWTIKHDAVLLLAVELIKDTKLLKDFDFSKLLMRCDFPQGMTSEYLRYRHKKIRDNHVCPNGKISSFKGDEIIKIMYVMCTTFEGFMRDLSPSEKVELNALRRTSFFLGLPYGKRVGAGEGFVDYATGPLKQSHFECPAALSTNSSTSRQVPAINDAAAASSTENKKQKVAERPKSAFHVYLKE